MKRRIAHLPKITKEVKGRDQDLDLVPNIQGPGLDLDRDAQDPDPGRAVRSQIDHVHIPEEADQSRVLRRQEN